VFLWQDEESGEIAFYMKGADIVMHNVVQYNDWMDEEVRRFISVQRTFASYFSWIVYPDVDVMTVVE